MALLQPPLDTIQVVEIEIIAIVAVHSLEDLLRGLGPPLLVHNQKECTEKKKKKV